MAAGREDLDRSSSPPGRESREDWWSGESEPSKNGRSLIGDRLGQRKERSRSRSPLRKGGKDRGDYSPTREMRYTREGTNTTSREPHLERARLFVGNIEPNHTHRRDLTKLFSQYGDVMGVSVHKGYAFVQMDRERTANRAINYEDNQIFMNSKIRKFIISPWQHEHFESHVLLWRKCSYDISSLFSQLMHTFSIIDVEFSQAALKAGAKCNLVPLIIRKYNLVAICSCIFYHSFLNPSLV